MGTPSTTKFIVNNAGVLTENTALTTSAGAGDSQKIPALNASGVLDSTITNGKIVSGGAGDSGKLVMLDASGKIDVTVLPTAAISADTAVITTSEALLAGDLVNVYNTAGTANVRKADASTAGKEAHGFVLAPFGSGVSATVYFEGSNNQVTGQTPGLAYLSATTPGKTSATPATGTGKIVQVVGFVTSATNINFQSNLPIVLA